MNYTSARMTYTQIRNNMVNEAREIILLEIEDKPAREAFLYVLESGRAIEIAERFHTVKDARTLLLGIGLGIIMAWKVLQ